MRSPRQQAQCSMHKRRHCYHWYAVFLKGQRRGPGDEVLPGGSDDGSVVFDFFVPMFVLKTWTFITDETLGISQGQTQGIAVF